ncbi:MAG: tetratricopeptide repeat protein, partial [Gammaproteobacteria bacterium]
AAESRLKLLLADEPEAGHLHFGLGNLYARQGRWPQAQDAYFNAYTTQPQNADYAFNLAVSLDHLAQRDAAMSYYQRALDLGDRQSAGFEPGDVLSRMQAMRAGGN